MKKRLMSNQLSNTKTLFSVSTSLLFLFFLSILQNSYSFESDQYFSTEPEIRFSSSDHVYIRIKVNPNKDFLLDLHSISSEQNNSFKIQQSYYQSASPIECKFVGHAVDSKLPSLASISYCNGTLNGLFEADGHVYLIKQSNSDSRVQIQIKANSQLHCGVPDQIINDYEIRQKRDTKIAYRKDAFNRTRFVELVIVNDYGIYQKYGKNVDFINERSKQIVNIVNSLYMPMNIHIVLSAVVIWTEKNEISISSDSSEMLNNFLKYRKEVLIDKYPNDNAQLITSKSFDSGIVGKALKQTMCSYEYSGGVNSDYSESISLVATTIAHELGHNFGMEHDHTDCDCLDKTCIMGPSSSFPTPTNWSSCSVEQLLKAFNYGIDTCLYNYPRAIFKPNCGNGIVDEGEQCDCGTEKACTNPCCDSKSCTFKPQAKCSNGDCCNLNTCQFHTTDYVCRSAKSVCDIEEKCTGYSEFCPDDNTVKDGTECNAGYAYCASGNCYDREQQCQLIWGDSSTVAEYRCYHHNLNSTSSGNCGYDIRTKKFTSCETIKDTICGRLHCSHSSSIIKPKYGPEGSAIMSISREIRRDKVIVCNSVAIDMGLDQVDPGLVPDGAKCGANSMCYKQKCVSTSKFLLNKPCPYNCYDNGICDNNGVCHCFNGFSSYYCSSKIGYIFTIIIYVFFFLILPLAIVFFVLKFCKPNIKNWFSRSQFGKQKNYHNSKKIFSTPVVKGDISVPLQTMMQGQQQIHPNGLTTTFPTMISSDLRNPPPLPKSAPVSTLQQKTISHDLDNHSHSVPTRPAPPVPVDCSKISEVCQNFEIQSKSNFSSKPQLKPMTSLGSSRSTSQSYSSGARPLNPPPPPPPPLPSTSHIFSNRSLSSATSQQSNMANTARFGVTLKPVNGSACNSRTSTRTNTPPPPVPAHKTIDR